MGPKPMWALCCPACGLETAGDPESILCVPLEAILAHVGWRGVGVQIKCCSCLSVGPFSIRGSSSPLSFEAVACRRQGTGYCFLPLGPAFFGGFAENQGWL